MTLLLSPATKAVKALWQEYNVADEYESALAECYITAIKADADSQIEALSKHVATSAIHEQALCACEDGHAQDMDELDAIKRERSYYAAAWRELAYIVDSIGDNNKALPPDSAYNQLARRVSAHRRDAARNGWHELGEPAQAQQLAEDRNAIAERNAKQLTKALSTIAKLRPAATAWGQMQAHFNETPDSNPWQVDPIVVGSIFAEFNRSMQAEQVEQLADETVQEIEEARRNISEKLDAEHANDDAQSA